MMNEWNKLVDKNWEYWEYYREMLDFALSKGANTFPTSALYPVFYQERLLRREFVENMQQLGELSASELAEYEDLRQNWILKYTFNYYKKPTGGYFGHINYGMVFFATIFPIIARYSLKPISWYIAPPILFIGLGTLVSHKVLLLNFPDVVDMTQWAIEQRKAKVWLEEKKHEPAKIAPLPVLKQQILEIVKNNRI